MSFTGPWVWAKRPILFSSNLVRRALSAAPDKDVHIVGRCRNVFEAGGGDRPGQHGTIHNIGVELDDHCVGARKALGGAEKQRGQTAIDTPGRTTPRESPASRPGSCGRRV